MVQFFSLQCGMWCVFFPRFLCPGLKCCTKQIAENFEVVKVIESAKLTDYVVVQKRNESNFIGQIEHFKYSETYKTDCTSNPSYEPKVCSVPLDPTSKESTFSHFCAERTNRKNPTSFLIVDVFFILRQINHYRENKDEL